MGKASGSSASPAEKPMENSDQSKKMSRARRQSIFAVVFNYLILGFVGVVAFISYLNWDSILKYVGTNACLKNVLATPQPKVPKLPVIAESKTANKKAVEQPTAGQSATKQAVKKQPTAAQPEEKKPTIEQKPAQQTSPTQSTKKDQLRQHWQAARKMFWENDKRAAKTYEALVKDYPGQIDIVGELGNVYYKNGDLAKAAQMFFKLGKLAHDAGQLNKTRKMIEVLNKMETKQAAGFAQNLSALLQ